MSDLATDIMQWLEHSAAQKRNSKQLAYYDQLWQDLILEIQRIEGCEAPMDYEADFARMAQYSGPLYRVHHQFEPEHPFGIVESASFVSWTKQKKFAEYSWLEKGKEILFIEGKAEFPEIGIDLAGIKNWANKYEHPLAFNKCEAEQEVVFPLKLEHIVHMEIRLIA
ncbi:hypothetical protein [Enterococcus pallens]|uniref:Uncharacterized protein n=1 Tax=Enterococcus pallens ATCC BAA-351 TaxID=1158607 RepID=R2Q0Y6_9ENTE|nr:hypothetical protein [Enterococcus pallens]EOH90232.1 hypothetical protein UAU_04061 [Enterococcus pallens ATCC BAA-351]EOU15162.1 hypothetical protein I588_04094 [Enterococcus pallens ATCC BAA-351]OJG79106.1 hypothetical protein RV10_GL000939 [Enterococcus pallens]